MFKRVALSLLCLLIPALLTPSVQGQSACEFVIDHPAGHAVYISIPADKTITSSPTTYLDPGCNTVDPMSLTEPPWFIRDGLVSAPDAETARKLCQSINRGPILKVTRWAYTNSVFMCWAGRADGRATDSEPTDESGGCPIDTDLLSDGLRLDAFDGMGSGIEFNRLDNCGVGNQSVIDMGFLDAVDIWSTLSAAATKFASLKSGASSSSMLRHRAALCSSSPITTLRRRLDLRLNGHRAGTMVLVNSPPGSSGASTVDDNHQETRHRRFD